MIEALQPGMEIRAIGDPVKEGRMKIAPMDKQLILEILKWKNRPEGSFLALPVSKDLPDGCEVVEVYYDHAHRSLMVIVAHPSFEPMPPGCHLPFVNEYVTEFRRILEKGAE